MILLFNYFVYVNVLYKIPFGGISGPVSFYTVADEFRWAGRPQSGPAAESKEKDGGPPRRTSAATGMLIAETIHTRCCDAASPGPNGGKCEWPARPRHAATRLILTFISPTDGRVLACSPARPPAAARPAQAKDKNDRLSLGEFPCQRWKAGVFFTSYLSGRPRFF